MRSSDCEAGPHFLLKAVVLANAPDPVDHVFVEYAHVAPQVDGFSSKEFEPAIDLVKALFIVPPVPSDDDNIVCAPVRWSRVRMMYARQLLSCTVH